MAHGDITHIDIPVADLAAATDAGGAILMAKRPIDDERWWAVISGPDGNVIGLYEQTSSD